MLSFPWHSLALPLTGATLAPVFGRRSTESHKSDARYSVHAPHPTQQAETSVGCFRQWGVVRVCCSVLTVL